MEPHGGLRMPYRLAIGVLLACLVIAPAAAARPPLHLEPSSKWDIDYGLERCSLSREFGSGDAAVHLQIDSFGFWNTFRVLLDGAALPNPSEPTGTANVQLTGHPKPGEARTLQGKVGKLPAISFDLGFIPYIDPETYRRMSDGEKEKLRAKMSQPQPDYDATVNWISVNPGPGTTIVLDVGNMAAPLAAMRACIDDMYKSWGFDPAEQKSLRALAVPLPSTVKHVETQYPHAELLSGTSAYVPVRLLIDANGEASSCVVQSTAVDAAFRQAACSNLQRKFKPALDAAGHPVASIYHTAVIYLVAR